jgi:hypothetical protein
VIGVAVVSLLVLLDFGLDPFGSVVLDRPWSRCGLTLCACTPEDSVPEPACPLCVAGDPVETPVCDAASGRGEECGAVLLVHRQERLGDGLPMLTELLSASLVLRLGGSPLHIKPPAACGAACVVVVAAPASRGLEIEPPPPRA